MKRILLLLLLLTLPLNNLFAQTNEINKEYLNKVVNAIYIAEGKDKTLYPYGIKSVSYSGSEEARKICNNTVRNHYRRWQACSCKKDFISCLGKRYCPNPTETKIWIKNVEFYIRKQTVNQTNK